MENVFGFEIVPEHELMSTIDTATKAGAARKLKAAFRKGPNADLVLALTSAVNVNGVTSESTFLASKAWQSEYGGSDYIGAKTLVLRVPLESIAPTKNYRFLAGDWKRWEDVTPLAANKIAALRAAFGAENWEGTRSTKIIAVESNSVVMQFTTFGS